jgi:hypothetical protein
MHVDLKKTGPRNKMNYLTLDNAIKVVKCSHSIVVHLCTWNGAMNGHDHGPRFAQEQLVHDAFAATPESCRTSYTYAGC